MQLSEDLMNALKERFGDAIQEPEPFRGEVILVVERDRLVPVCEFLRDDPDFAFNFLAALTAVDHWPEEPRFTVVYQLYSVARNAILGLRVRLPGDDPRIRTIEGVYPNADWHEREVYDMFGVTFEGHSDLRRILMAQDWEGHPLRKDYPLGYEEVQFSFNFDEIDRRKHYAGE
jgi:NADH-quinone oxidoreductase subunit C